MKVILILLFFLFSSFLLKAQYYSIGEDRAGISWRQINTNEFQIIYPSSFEGNARRMAYILAKVYQYAGKTLDHKPHKIAIVLHTGTVSSNGFVIWAPSRMELFTTPPQDIYAQDWLEQLAIHEFRHVVQIDKIESEMPKIFKIILGEQAAAIVTGAYLPSWLLEGDAVATETALSHAGRGRLPAFERELRAQVLEKGIYSYDKAYLGSFRDHVPDYYQMGYQMAASARIMYGSEVWSKAVHNVARNPLSITPFSRELKKITGKNQSDLYLQVFNGLKSKWRSEDKDSIKSQYRRLTTDDSNYSNYRFPQRVNDSTIFALKTSIDDIPGFFLIHPDGREERIFTPGNLSDGSISFADNKIFWIENKPDPRWGLKELSLLRIFDLGYQKLFEKKYKEKIFSPTLSSDHKYIACVKIDQKNNCSVLLLSPMTGKVIKETTVPDNLYLITPSWGEKENILFSIALGPEGKSLISFNPFNQEIKYLLPFSFNQINYPKQKGNYIYYNSSQDGIDNIFVLDLNNAKTYKLTSSRFGTMEPQPVENGELLYSDYTANGFCIANLKIREENMIKVDSAETFQYKLADEISSQEKGIIKFEVKSDSMMYTSRKYSKFGHLFSFHSWAPVHIDTDQEEIRPGFSLFSQNKLSTAVTQIGFDYSTVNRSGKWYGKFEYRGWYPVLEFSADYGKGKSQYLNITHIKDPSGQTIRTDTTLVGFSYYETNLNGNIKLPLNLSHGRMIRFIRPEFQFGYSYLRLGNSVPSTLIHGSFIPLTYRLYGSNYQLLSYRDLQPRFGQTMNLIYRHSPFGTNDYGNIRSAEGSIFLPGLIKHHGIHIYGAYQIKHTSRRSFSDLIQYPRGYQNLLNKELSTIRSDYVFPLIYPDLNFGKLSYFKRISLRLFYDYGRAVIPVNQRAEQIANYQNFHFSSLGSELVIDCHFLRFILPSTIGIRHSFLLEKRKDIIEFLFSMNLNQFKTFR